VGRPKMEEHRVELLHREVVDFEHLPCNDCHEVKRVKLAVTSETCSKRCHHHHGGKEKISGGAVKSHAIHRSARCMDCHEEVEHKMGSEKFLSVQRSPFGKQFKHRGHMELDCTECHVERDGHFVQKLKSRADCSRCHHDGVEDADMCEGCHDTQSEFFKGSGKFGFEETPSMKAEMETGCDACHGDVRKYEPKQLTESCTNCHEEGDADYDLAKLLDGGKKALGDAMTKLKSLKDEITAAGEKGVKAEMLESAGRAAGEVEKMLAFLRNDASFGLHNPGLFSEYISKANEMVGEALKQLKEESK